MEIGALILSIANFVVIAVVLLLLRNYLPSYLSEKAKNLATKEDIETITDKVEGIKSQYLAEIEKLRKTLEEQSKILEKRRTIYEEVADSLRVFTSGHEASLENKERFLSAYAKAWLWAPDSVVGSLNCFLETQINHVKDPVAVTQDDMKAAYAAIVSEMRRDVGFNDTVIRQEDYKFVSF